jgi:hypothetical protein
MATTAFRQERIAGIAALIVTLAITGIAIAWGAVRDNALALLQALPTSRFAGGLGLFLIIYGVLVLLQPDRLRIELSGWRPAWQWAPPEALSAGFPLSRDDAGGLSGLRDVSKAGPRGTTPPYILALQLISLSLVALTHSVLILSIVSSVSVSAKS